MPRKRLIRSDVFPYHLTARTNNRELFPIPLEEVWKILESESYSMWLTYGLEIQALVLMPNHFHMIATVPQFDLGKVMTLFMANVTVRIHYKSGRSGHVFGGPYFWSIIQSTLYYGHVLKYVYRNPVRAGLCDQVQDYPYSTLRGLLGFERLAFPIYFTRAGMELNIPDPNFKFSWLEWLNQPFALEEEEWIRMAMKKREIKELKDEKTRRPVEILKNLL